MINSSDVVVIKGFTVVWQKFRNDDAWKLYQQTLSLLSYSMQGSKYKTCLGVGTLVELMFWWCFSMHNQINERENWNWESYDMKLNELSFKAQMWDINMKQIQNFELLTSDVFSAAELPDFSFSSSPADDSVLRSVVLELSSSTSKSSESWLFC